MTIIDTHCHLDFPNFDTDRADMFDRADAAGVDGFVLIGINPESWASTRAIARERENVWRTAGVHPNSAAELWSRDVPEKLRDEAASGELVGIGETGIDLYRSSESLEIQREAFRQHIQLAKSLELPIVIHQREAESEVLDILRREGGARGVLHCFGGDWEFAHACLELGLSLGIGGVATYKRSDATRDAISKAPVESLVLETDAPFLAPQSRRGKRNEPANLTEVVDVIAACRSTTAAEIERQTTENACRLFGISLASREMLEQL